MDSKLSLCLSNLYNGISVKKIVIIQISDFSTFLYNYLFLMKTSWVCLPRLFERNRQTACGPDIRHKTLDRNWELRRKCQQEKENLTVLLLPPYSVKTNKDEISFADQIRQMISACYRHHEQHWPRL